MHKLGVDIFTSGQVADACRVATRTVAKWIDAGMLPYYRLTVLGGRPAGDRRVRRADLLRFMREHGFPTDVIEGTLPGVLLVGLDAHTIGQVTHELGSGYRFASTPSLFDAGHLVQEFQPQTIIFDLGLGRSECVNAVSAIRKRKDAETLKLIAIVGEETPTVELVQAGFTDAYKRPLDISSIVSAINGNERGGR